MSKTMSRKGGGQKSYKVIMKFSLLLVGNKLATIGGSSGMSFVAMCTIIT